MKKYIVLLVLVIHTGLFLDSLYAMELGQPEPYAENGILGYFYYPNLTLKTDNSALPADIEITQHQFFWQYSFLNRESYELYGRLGFFEMRIADAFAFADGVKDFRSGPNFYGALGAKGVLFKNERWSCGPFILFTMYEESEERAEAKIAGKKISSTLVLSDIWHLKYGLAFQGEISGITVYGGPLGVIQNAEFRGNTPVFSISEDINAEYKEKDSAGVYFGVKIPLDQTLAITIETEYTGNLAGGISINVKFE